MEVNYYDKYDWGKTKGKKIVLTTIITIVAVFVVLAVAYFHWQYVIPTSSILSVESGVISDNDLETAQRILEENNIRYEITEDKKFVLVSQLQAVKATNCLKGISFECDLTHFWQWSLVTNPKKKHNK